MRARWFQITMVLWLTAWYGVIVPGHQRGMVVVAGADRTMAQRLGDSCCDAPRAAAATPACHQSPEDAAPTSDDPAPKKPDPTRVKNCAVCAIAGLIDLPPPLVLSPVERLSQPTQLIGRDLRPHELPGHTIPFTRGPPAAA